jgi:hypothetical protein
MAVSVSPCWWWLTVAIVTAGVDAPARSAADKLAGQVTADRLR